MDNLFCFKLTSAVALSIQDRRPTMRFLDILNTLHMIQKKTKQVKQIRKDNNTDLDHSIGHKSVRGGDCGVI